MERDFGFYIILGMLIGAIFGVSLVPIVGNTILAIFCGVCGGVFFGWLIAVAASEKAIHKNDQNPEE